MLTILAKMTVICAASISIFYGIGRGIEKLTDGPRVIVYFDGEPIDMTEIYREMEQRK